MSDPGAVMEHDVASLCGSRHLMRSAHVAWRARPEGLALVLAAAPDSLVRHHVPTATPLAAGSSSTPVSKRCAGAGQARMGGSACTRTDLQPEDCRFRPRSILLHGLRSPSPGPGAAATRSRPRPRRPRLRARPGRQESPNCWFRDSRTNPTKSHFFPLKPWLAPAYRRRNAGRRPDDSGPEGETSAGCREFENALDLGKHVRRRSGPAAQRPSGPAAQRPSGPAA